MNSLSSQTTGLRVWWIGAALLAAAAGCSPRGAGPTTYPDEPIPADITKEHDSFTNTVTAGVPLPPASDSGQWTKMAKAKTFASRPDPFALTASEETYDSEAFAQWMFDQWGLVQAYDPIPEPVLPDVRPEPQPADRRLAGVLIGDSVVAIIEMGNGASPQIVHPGERVPGTEWTVVSIDPEKAILHRDGDRQPHDVTVRLEPRP